MKKLLIVVNVDWFFISHRLAIAQKAKSQGFDVFIACEDTGRINEITEKGLKFVPISFTRSGTKLREEVNTVWQLYKLYRKVKPDIVHHVTLKPVIYGSIIAKFLKINGVVNAIAGLGYNFTGERKGLLFFILTNLMRFGMDRNNLAVIFQNKQDFHELQSLSVLSSKNKVFFTKGSGVDLRKFAFTRASEKSRINILFPTRMLWDKGVRELYEASKLLKSKYSNKVIFTLAGLADEDNKAGVPASFLNKWSDGLYVKWIGYQKNIYAVYQESDIVVLPSYYREGIPKSLIEACAVGKPIITTDSIGCRECVDEGINGYKILPRDSKALADVIEKLINDSELRKKMGIQSRLKAEKEFNVEVVIQIHMEIYTQLLSY